MLGYVGDVINSISSLGARKIVADKVSQVLPHYNKVLTSVKLLATSALRVPIFCRVASACCMLASELLSAEHKLLMNVCMDFKESLEVQGLETHYKLVHKM